MTQHTFTEGRVAAFDEIERGEQLPLYLVIELQKHVAYLNFWEYWLGYADALREHEASLKPVVRIDAGIGIPFWERAGIMLRFLFARMWTDAEW